MNKTLEFKSDMEPIQLVKKTKEYFLTQGFKSTSDLSNLLIFERGSKSLNIITFNPLKWKSSTQIKFDNGLIIADFDINTNGQLVTTYEERLWDQFIENYKRTILNDQVLIQENYTKLKKTKSLSWNYLLYALIGAIIFGIIGVIIADFTGVFIFVPILSVSGALCMLSLKIKNAP